MKEECESDNFAIMKFRFMAKLTIYVVSLSFILFAAVIFLPIPKENAGNANTIVGFIILTVGGLTGYYFGSSQSTSAHAERDVTPKSEKKEK